MLELKLVFFVILAVGGLLWAFYWTVIRPTFLTRIRYQMFALRDSLRSLAIKGRCDASSFSFRHLEGMLNEMAAQTFSYSVSDLLEFLILDVLMSRQTEAEGKARQEIDRFQAEAGRDLRSIEDESLRLIKVAMLLNSPWWSLFGSMILLVRSIKRRIDVCNRGVWYRMHLQGT
jgi:hypothetical protein